MSTTTGDPSTLKTPPTLSGGDLVSRLLAATPPYLYNVPLTPHSFFFSEMLRSFVQAKADASSGGSGPPAVPRRRKRSWRDARDGRDRPLELTTKERPNDKYFTGDGHSEHKSKHLSVHHSSLNFDNKTSNLGGHDANGKSLDEGKSEFCRHGNYFDDRQPFGGSNLQPSSQTAGFAPEQKVKPEEQLPGERKLGERFEDVGQKSPGDQTGSVFDPKNKPEFSPRNFPPCIPGRADILANPKNFGLSAADAPNPDFLPAPMWYPPYPMPQSYPGIDPLHFFIDLRVSGHIWDRKLAERQPSFKSKHTSAFNVPQSKEYNRPLNLTRDEASSSRTRDENSKGTHYILKNLTKTYKGIRGSEKSDEEVVDGSEANNGSSSSSQPENKEEDKKDIRALIGLELVVDYVKDPKDAVAGGKNSPTMSE